MARYILIIGAFLGGSSSELFGQEISPIQTDRPDQTETPFTVPKNHFQMENGFSFESAGKNTQSFTHPSSLLKYGINDHFDVGLIMEFVTIQSDSKIYGLSPVTIRFKEKITDEKGIIPTTAFIGYLTIPYVASEKLKISYFAPAFRFTMQHTLPGKFSLGYNLGAEWDGETPVPAFIYTLTTGYSISDKIGAFLELYGFVPQELHADHRFTCGLSYLFRPNVLFDISGGVGITDNSPDYYLAFGFSFRLKD
jgi:hypothetical protein